MSIKNTGMSALGGVHQKGYKFLFPLTVFLKYVKMYKTILVEFK